MSEKVNNLVAKHARKYNKAAVHKDRKKAMKKGERKHKGRYEDSGDIEERSTLDAISSVLKRNKDRSKYQAALKAVKSGKYNLPKAAQVFDVSPRVLQDLVSEERNYKKEYENYHSDPEQKKRRAARNGARRMLKDRKNIKGMDVHHKDNNPLNNDKSNLSIVTQHYNRKEPRMRKEALGADATAKDYIDDFQKSDAPQFKGKSAEKRKEMAVAAYLDAKRGQKEEGVIAPVGAAVMGVSAAARAMKVARGRRQRAAAIKNHSSQQTNEDLRKWFGKGKEGDWVRVGTDGEIKGDCARDEGEGKPKCMPRSKAHGMDKKDRASAARRKRHHDPDTDRPGTGNKPIMVKTKKESIEEKSQPTDPKLWAKFKAQAKSKFDVYPSAYANGWAAKQYKAAGGGWKTVKEDISEDLRASPPKEKPKKVGQRAVTPSHIGPTYPKNKWVVKKNTASSKAYNPLIWTLEESEEDVSEANYEIKNGKRVNDCVPKNEEVDSRNTPGDGNPCWDTHKKVGTKMKNGKRVNDCVPKNEEVEESAYDKFMSKKGIDIPKPDGRNSRTPTKPKTKNLSPRQQAKLDRNIAKDKAASAKAGGGMRKRGTAVKTKAHLNRLARESAQDRLNNRAAKHGLGQPNKAADSYMAKMKAKHGEKGVADMKAAGQARIDAWRKAQQQKESVELQERPDGVGGTTYTSHSMRKKAMQNPKVAKRVADVQKREKERKSGMSISQKLSLRKRQRAGQTKRFTSNNDRADAIAKKGGAQLESNGRTMAKEALSKVDIEGFPTMFVDGAPAQVKTKLRKMFKSPDYIKSVERSTPADSKKYFRGKSTGKEEEVSQNESMDPRDFTDKAGYLVTARVRGKEEIKNFFHTKPAAEKYANRVNQGGNKATIYKTNGRNMVKEEHLAELTKREMEMLAKRKQSNLVKRGKAKPEPKKSGSAGRTYNVGAGKDEADDNVIMQLRKAQDMRGNHQIKFQGGQTKLPPKMIDKLLNTYDKLGKPADKKRFVTLVTHELRKKEGVGKSAGKKTVDPTSKLGKMSMRKPDRRKGSRTSGPSNKELQDIERGK